LVANQPNYALNEVSERTIRIEPSSRMRNFLRWKGTKSEEVSVAGLPVRQGSQFDSDCALADFINALIRLVRHKA